MKKGGAKVAETAKNLLFSLVIVCVFFGAFEIGSRLYARSKHKLDEFESLIELQGVKTDNKAAGEKRIFIIGESAARGVPYTMDSSMSGYLQVLLNNSGNNNVKVVNLGVPGRHSFYQRELPKTLVAYKADAVIVYAGNNDSRDFSNVMRDVPLAYLDFKLAHDSYFYRGYKIKLMSLKKSVNKLSKKKVFDINYNQDDVWHWTDSYLKKKKTYLENPPLGLKRKEQAIRDFQMNLDHMVKELRKDKIAVFVVNLPIVHGAAPAIGDWSRKDYEFNQKIIFHNAAEEESWRQLYAQGEKAFQDKDYPSARRFFEAAEKIDATYPLLSYNLGRTLEALGDDETARKLYVRAKDLQIQSAGGDSFKTAALEAIAKQNGVPFVDVQKPLEEMSPHGIVGKNFFLDHCHPNSLGHKLIASVLMEQLCRAGFVSCSAEQADWRKDFETLTGGQMTPQNLAREYLLVAFYHFKGTAWGSKPEYVEAIEYLLLAKQITPENKDIYPILAAAYWNTDQKEKAKEAMDELKKLNPVEFDKTFSDFPYLQALYQSRK